MQLVLTIVARIVLLLGFFQIFLTSFQYGYFIEAIQFQYDQPCVGISCKDGVLFLNRKLVFPSEQTDEQSLRKNSEVSTSMRSNLGGTSYNKEETTGKYRFFPTRWSIPSPKYKIYQNKGITIFWSGIRSDAIQLLNQINDLFEHPELELDESDHETIEDNEEENENSSKSDLLVNDDEDDMKLSSLLFINVKLLTDKISSLLRRHQNEGKRPLMVSLMLVQQSSSSSSLSPESSLFQVIEPNGECFETPFYTTMDPVLRKMRNSKEPQEKEEEEKDSLMITYKAREALSKISWKELTIREALSRLFYCIKQSRNNYEILILKENVITTLL
jgi:hypothetical protein